MRCWRISCSSFWIQTHSEQYFSCWDKSQVQICEHHQTFTLHNGPNTGVMRNWLANKNNWNFSSDTYSKGEANNQKVIFQICCKATLILLVPMIPKTLRSPLNSHGKCCLWKAFFCPKMVQNKQKWPYFLLRTAQPKFGLKEALKKIILIGKRSLNRVGGNSFVFIGGL